MNSSPQHPSVVQGRSLQSVTAGRPVESPEKLESAENPSFPPLGLPSRADVARGPARKRKTTSDGGARDPQPNSPAQEESSDADDASSRSKLRKAKRNAFATEKSKIKAEAELQPITGAGAEAPAEENPPPKVKKV